MGIIKFLGGTKVSDRWSRDSLKSSSSLKSSTLKTVKSSTNSGRSVLAPSSYHSTAYGESPALRSLRLRNTYARLEAARRALDIKENMYTVNTDHDINPYYSDPELLAIFDADKPTFMTSEYYLYSPIGHLYKIAHYNNGVDVVLDNTTGKKLSYSTYRRDRALLSAAQNAPVLSTPVLKSQPSLSTAKQSTTSKQPISKSSTHVVKTGDTLWNIAQANGITIQLLLDYNPEIKNRKNNLIMVGDTLHLKGAKTTSKRSYNGTSKKIQNPTPSNTYTIRKGDTLAGISKKTGISIKDLLSMNGIFNNDKIYAGDVLKLKGDKYYHPTPTVPLIEIKPIVDTSVPKIVINGINV